MQTRLIMTMLLVGCPALGGAGGGGGSGGGSAGGETLSSNCASADFGAGAAAQRIGAFLAATGNFTNAAVELQTGLTDVCKTMGAESRNERRRPQW